MERRRHPLALLIALGLAPLAAVAQPPTVRQPGWTAGWHVVRPGDTLEGLARRFLGSHDHWQALHLLNPDLVNPHYLRPGQRIRIWVSRPSLQPTAQIEQVAGRVDERPAPVPWRPAAEGDFLIERDGLRTFERGSSRLRFEDDSRVTLTENSLVFIRHQSPSTAPVSRKEIEIRLGQADVEAEPVAGRTPNVDIVLGAATGHASSAPGGALHARSRAEEQGTARVMIYRGQGEVAAAGARVELPEGTGSSVAPRQRPTPAETLLPAPEPVFPGPDGELGLDEPKLAWRPVPGASSYTVEICADAGCGQLFERTTSLAETSYRLRATPTSPLYWRVTAAGASGLDGYPSPARAFRPVESLGPPAPTLTLLGADGSPVAAEVCVPEAPRIAVEALDRYGRQLPWTLVVGGSETAVARAFPASGRYEVAAIARDERGRSASSPPAAFRLDLTAPWADFPGDPDAGDPRSAWSFPSADPAAICALGLEVSLAGGAWMPVPCATEGDAEPLVLELDGSSAALELRGAGSARLAGTLALAAGRSAELALGDLGCGLARARVRIARDGENGPPALEIVTVDRSGRTGTSSWRVVAR